MSLIPEMIKGRLHSLVERAHLHGPTFEAPPHHNYEPHSTEEIPWDKFRRFFQPLPESVAKVKAESLTFGDVYTTQRLSGKELTIVPMHFQGWRSKRSSIDMLLILGFNENNAVVGMRTVAMDLSSPEFVSAEGAVASAVCNDGIASALEQVRHRTSEELLMAYRDKGFFFHQLHHTVVDENKKVIAALKDKSEQASDPLINARYNHAIFDRPRWETLFDPGKSGFEQEGVVLRIDPDELLDRGFRSSRRTVYHMVRTPGQSGRATWKFEDLGPEKYADIADMGLLNKNYVQRRMADSITTPPEI